MGLFDMFGGGGGGGKTTTTTTTQTDVSFTDNSTINVPVNVSTGAVNVSNTIDLSPVERLTGALSDANTATVRDFNETLRGQTELFQTFLSKSSRDLGDAAQTLRESAGQQGKDIQAFTAYLSDEQRKALIFGIIGVVGTLLLTFYQNGGRLGFGRI